MTKQKTVYFSRVKCSVAIGELPNLEKMYGKKKSQQMLNEVLNHPDLNGKSIKKEIKSFIKSL